MSLIEKKRKLSNSYSLLNKIRHFYRDGSSNHLNEKESTILDGCINFISNENMDIKQFDVFLHSSFNNIGSNSSYSLQISEALIETTKTNGEEIDRSDVVSYLNNFKDNNSTPPDNSFVNFLEKSLAILKNNLAESKSNNNLLKGL